MNFRFCRRECAPRLPLRPTTGGSKPLTSRYILPRGSTEGDPDGFDDPAAFRDVATHDDRGEIVGGGAAAWQAFLDLRFPSELLEPLHAHA